MRGDFDEDELDDDDGVCPGCLRTNGACDCFDDDDVDEDDEWPDEP